MSRKLKLSERAASVGLDAILALLNGGKLRIYTDSGALLAEMGFADPAFGKAQNGEATANAIAGEQSAPGTGTASRFKAEAAGGQIIFEGTVGTAGADIVLPTTAIHKGMLVSVTRLTYRLPRE